MTELIDSRPGKRDQFSEDAGFSTRLSTLLNGQRAWYLEDVERACATLDLDVVDFLDSIDPAPVGEVIPLVPGPGPGTPHPALPSVTRYEEGQAPGQDSPGLRSVARKRGKGTRTSDHEHGEG